MGSKKYVVLLVAVLAALPALLVVQGWRGFRGGNSAPPEDFMDVDWDSVTTIKGRLLSSTELDQEETDYHQLPLTAKTAKALFYPCKISSIPKSRYSHICEIVVNERRGRSVTFTVHWMGKSRVLFSGKGPFCYLRESHAHPVKKDMFLDEAMSIRELIKAVATNNEEVSKVCDIDLQQSTGLLPAQP